MRIKVRAEKSSDDVVAAITVPGRWTHHNSVLIVRILTLTHTEQIKQPSLRPA